MGCTRSPSPVLSRLIEFPSSTFDASTWRLLIVCRRLDWRCWTTEGPGWLSVGLGSAGVCCAWRGGGACFASAPSLGRRWAGWGPNTRDEEFKGFQSFVNNGFWARLEAWAVGLGYIKGGYCGAPPGVCSEFLRFPSEPPLRWWRCRSSVWAVTSPSTTWLICTLNQSGRLRGERKTWWVTLRSPWLRWSDWLARNREGRFPSWLQSWV